MPDSFGSTDFVVDIVGYFTVDPAAPVSLATSRTALDTRADPAYHVGSPCRRRPPRPSR